MPHRRTAAEERDLLRQWNAAEPIDGREHDPPHEQRHIDDYADDMLDEGDAWEEDAFDEDDCGYIPGVGCSAAGTEECDWDCPVHAAMRRRRRTKKGKA